MILGVGIDLIEIERIKKACTKSFFIKKTYTQKECQQAKESISFLAGNFATKEALVKAFGIGFRNIELKEIEVLRDELGKPYIILYNKALDLFKHLNCTNIHVSITNTKDQAISTVILEK